jgi:hypothetical protein
MTVFPEQHEIRDVAKLLLQLADSPQDVMTTLDPTLGFRIPAWLYETFVATWDLRRKVAGMGVDVSNMEFSNDPISDEFIAEIRAEATPEQQAELDRFQAARKLSAEVLAASGTETIEVKRKPGRPRKEVK